MTKYNIYYRKDGRYEGRIPRGKRLNGKRKFQYVFGKTRESVMRRIDELRRDEANLKICKANISTLFREWFQGVSLHIKESTAANYLMKFKKHIEPVFGRMNPCHINQDDIYGFIEERKKHGLSTRYISDILILLKSVFKYAVRIYHIFNPMEGISMPQKRNVEIRLFDSHEKKKLQNYINNNQNETSLGIALSMVTGIRIGELCALTWKDIDLEKRVLTVSQTIQRIQCPFSTAKTKLIITEPKSESSKRSIPVPECIIAYLRKFKSSEEHFVLSGSDKPVEPRVMQYRFSKILTNEKLPSIHFHALRHMFASECIRLGFDVKALSEILGHSSVEITLNRYVHSSLEQKRLYMKRITL